MQGYFNIWISANMPNLINKFKNKNYYIISTCTEKAFQKLNILMLILNKVGMEEIYLNIINAKHDQLSQYHNQHWKVNSILSKIRNKTRMCICATFIQHSIESSSCRNKTGERNNRNLNLKGRSNTVNICRWHDTI